MALFRATSITWNLRLTWYTFQLFWWYTFGLLFTQKFLFFLLHIYKIYQILTIKYLSQSMRFFFTSINFTMLFW